MIKWSSNFLGLRGLKKPRVSQNQKDRKIFWKLRTLVKLEIEYLDGESLPYWWTYKLKDLKAKGRNWNLEIFEKNRDRDLAKISGPQKRKDFELTFGEVCFEIEIQRGLCSKNQMAHFKR